MRLFQLSCGGHLVVDYGKKEFEQSDSGVRDMYKPL
jgi:hypothetical protein